MSTPPRPGALPVPEHGDFGRLTFRAPAEVLRPQSTGEVLDIVRALRAQGQRVTTRGFGYSQGGQSVAPNTASLRLDRLHGIDAVDVERRTITCEPGARWRDVVEACLAHDLVPRVLPLNLDLSVGGTLSVGGIGSTSHRFGVSAANVPGVEVVTGDAQHVSCHANHEPELYRSVLGGLGLFGVITRATIALRRAFHRVHSTYYLYDDIDVWLADQHQLAQRAQQWEGAMHLEGYCSPAVQGLRNTPQGRRPFAHWFYGLNVAVEGPERADGRLDDGLRPYRTLHREHMDTMAFAARYDPRFAMMRASGADALAHPWFECLLPIAACATVLPEALKTVPLLLGGGHRFFLINVQQAPTFFAKPATEPVACFAILPAGVPEPLLDETLEALQHLEKLVVEAGGKRYPSGWLGTMGAHHWPAHFGERYELWLTTRQRYDPDGMFGSVLLPSHREIAPR